MDRSTHSEAVAAVYAAKDVGELTTRYDEWSDTYDAENIAAGFRLPQICAAFFARHVGVIGSLILDAGCGTGLVGDILHLLGYRMLVGLDLSEPMLLQAAKRGLYSSLHQMTLGESLDFPSSRFSAVVSSGVFTEGHAPHSSFDELIRVTRTGGYLVFNVRDDVYEQRGFRARQDQLEAEGRWRLRERSEPFRSFTLKEPHILARVFVYEVV